MIARSWVISIATQEPLGGILRHSRCRRHAEALHGGCDATGNRGWARPALLHRIAYCCELLDATTGKCTIILRVCIRKERKIVLILQQEERLVLCSLLFFGLKFFYAWWVEPEMIIMMWIDNFDDYVLKRAGRNYWTAFKPVSVCIC